MIDDVVNKVCDNFANELEESKKNARETNRVNNSIYR